MLLEKRMKTMTKGLEKAKMEMLKPKWRKRLGYSLLAGTMVSITAESIRDRIDNLLFEEEIRRDIVAYITLFHVRYGVNIELATSDGETSNYRYVDSLNMLKWTADIVALFPDEMVKDKLHGIALGEDVTNDAYGSSAGSWLSVDLKNQFPRVVEERAFKSVLTHELQHFFDRAELAKQDDKKNIFVDWRSINPPSVRYDFSDISSSYYPVFSDFTETDGFVFSYQKKNASEDRAVMAQILFAPEVVEDVSIILDSLIRNKADTLRQFYSESSGGKMDEKYWEDYREGKVGFFYWLDQEREKEKEPVNNPK